MKKSRLFTMYIFLLSLGVVLGGWHLTVVLLEQRREEFLGRTGEIFIQSPEMPLPSGEKQEDTAAETAENVPFQGETLTEDMMAEILTVWESGSREIPHEPEKGQMNMEQAIEAGKEWIAMTAEAGIIPPEAAGEEFEHISARLCTLEAEADIDENLISYWSMQFITENMEVSLTIHAMSGDVWKAKIRMNEQDWLWDSGRQEHWLEIAFPFMEEGDEVILYLDGNTTCVPMPQKLVFASVRGFSILVSGRKPTVQIEFWLSTM